MNSFSQSVWTMPLSLLSYFFFPTAAVSKSPFLLPPADVGLQASDQRA